MLLLLLLITLSNYFIITLTLNIHMNSIIKHNFQWQQTMLRIKDPLISIPFYCNNFGFKLIHKYDFPQWSFSLYFLQIPNPLDESKVDSLVPSSKESEEYLWTLNGVCLELTHNYGSENDENFKVNNGNVEPYRGFGHIALMTPDVYKACDELQSNNVKFQKLPNEGRMKGLAFALDPDGYWIEIISRSQKSIVPSNIKYTLAQTMKRIKDPKKSLHFYRDLLGMTLISEKHFGVGEDWGFSLYFLANVSKDRELPSPTDVDASSEVMREMFEPVLELTHNHGTENKPDFKYHNGNDQDEGQLRGFGHIGFLVDDLDKACEYLESSGVAFKKKPLDGSMRGLAFVYDPDNYWVEIIQRNGLKLIQ